MTTLEFSAMVQKYQSLVYTVCHQLVPDAGDAQDLTQETFLAAWRAIDRCPSGFEKQWLARIAANKAKDYLRSAWVRRVNIPGDDVLALEGAPPGTQPEQQVLDALGEEELTAMILDLREPYRTPCRLVLLEQHTMAEAGITAPEGKVIGFDVQEAAIASTRKHLEQLGVPAARYELHCQSHADLLQIVQPGTADAVMFNFGWLPGADAYRPGRCASGVPTVMRTFAGSSGS